MEPDFSGWATKAGLKCSDGRVITPDAFAHQDKMRVPLVYQHGHTDPEDVLGHAILTHRPGEGIWADAFFNNTKRAQHMKEAVIHKDINFLSIWANSLVERAKQVLHGTIREVSLVLAGANPGAVIEQVHIRHSDGSTTDIDDEAIITTGIELVLEHSAGDGEEVKHSDDDGDDTSGKTPQQVYDSMNEEQKELLHIMLEKAAEGDGGDSDDKGDADDGELKQSHTDPDPKEKDPMNTRNVFEKEGDDVKTGGELTHSQRDAIHSEIFADAQRLGTLREAIDAAVVKHGITNLESLFPEARNLDTPPEWDKRDTTWVGIVLNGTRKTPFSRIKTRTADITFEEARAKGYVKGNLKKEEWFTVAHRETTPQTVYKKQKLDRDDILDITDFDVVSWMKGEMRMMLEEELARAILVGDGRDIADDDKIQEGNIRPIATDDPYYTVSMGVGELTDDAAVKAALDAMVLNRQFYKGSGSPSFFTTETFISRCLVLRDADGHRMYRTEADLAAEMRVSRLVAVEILDEYPDIIGIMVNLRDYVVGADRGGQTTMFDDFDIDYNQYKYLIETRVCGALVKPRSAMVLLEGAGGDTGIVPEAPTYDPDTWTVTVPTQTGTTYVDQNGATVAAGAKVLAAGEYLRLTAIPDTGYFYTGGKNYWSFLRAPGT